MGIPIPTYEDHSTRLSAGMRLAPRCRQLHKQSRYGMARRHRDHVPRLGAPRHGGASRGGAAASLIGVALAAPRTASAVEPAFVGVAGSGRLPARFGSTLGIPITTA